MSVELLQTLSIVFFVLAGVFLIVSILLFFLLGVPDLFLELTGKKEKRAIESIRQQNAEGSSTQKSVTKKQNTMKKSYHSSGTNADYSPITEKFSTKELNPSNETTILNDSYSTAAETTILQPNFATAAETTILDSNNFYGSYQEEQFNGFVLEYELVYMFTTEIID